MSQAAAVITLDDRRSKASEAEDVQVAIGRRAKPFSTGRRGALLAP